LECGRVCPLDRLGLGFQPLLHKLDILYTHWNYVIFSDLPNGSAACRVVSIFPAYNNSIALSRSSVIEGGQACNA
jgi:hypothetical protein